MTLKEQIFYWLHPYQAVIKIANYCLDEKLAHMQSYHRGEQLTQQALQSSAPGVTERQFIDGQEVIVSLTTHDKRFYEVFKTIESIMQGTWLPNRIILWLPLELRDTPLPETLRRQQKRGLEIAYTTDLGPHTKLIPALRRYPDAAIVTVDDDMYYQYDMLENLIRAYTLDPHSIHANRVSVITFNADLTLKSYLDWQHYLHPHTDPLYNMIIGVEGCLYPPHALADEVFNADVFRHICRYADDVWFTAMAMLQGTPVRHLYTHYPRGCAGGIENKPVQDIGLFHQNDNHYECRNDVQIRAVFDRYDLYSFFRSTHTHTRHP